MGAIQVNVGNLSQGQVVAIINYMSQILVELIKLANLIVTVTKGIASAKRIDAVMTLVPSISFPTKSASADENTALPAVIFDNVSLTYKNAGDASISNISFTARSGETIGIQRADCWSVPRRDFHRPSAPLSYSPPQESLSCPPQANVTVCWVNLP